MIYPTFKGKVIEGNRIGRTLGFPTANIATSDNIPSNGVYIAKIALQDKFFYGLLSIGTRPTLDLKEMSIEVFIFDFMGDIYQQEMQVTPLHYIRNEITFNSLKELKTQLERDRDIARQWLKEFSLH